MTETLILDELRRLQQQVAALQRAATRRHRVTLTPVQPQPWLGQAVTLALRVTDEEAMQPRVDWPVLLTTTWGRLRAADGYTLQTGESVVARTDLNGGLTVTLLPPLVEELWEPQQRALETLLAQFDPAAPTPTTVVPAFNAAIEQYQQATAEDLRAAIDFYFQHFYQPRLATLFTYDWLQRWQTINATVIVVAPENLLPLGDMAGETLPLLAATVQGAAVLPLHFKDWLGPWLQSYINLASAQGNLRQQFTLLKELTKNPEELVAATADLVQAAVRNQVGRTGELIEQQVVYGVVTALLDQDIQELPVATRVKLLTGLPPATDTVHRLGSRAGANLEQSAADLKSDLAQRVDSKVGSLNQAQGVLDSRLTGVEGTVGGLQAVVQHKAERSDLTALQGQFAELGKGTQTLTTRLDSLQSNFTNLDESVGGFRGDLDRLREEVQTGGNLELVTKLQEQLADVTTALQKFDRRFATFQEKTVAQLATTLARDEFVRFQSELGQQVAKLGERTDVMQTQFGKLQNEFGRFDTSLNKVQIDLRDVQEELKRRPGLQVIQELQATLATLSNTLTTLNTDVTTFRDQVTLRLTDTVTNTELTQVRTELDRALSTKIDQQLAQSFGDLDSRFRTLQTDVSAFRSNITRLRGDLDTLGTNVSKIRLDVDRLGPRP